MAINSEGSREIIAADKTSEKPQLYQQGVKQAKHPRVSMDLQLFHRRKTMLVTFHSGRLNPTTLEQMAQDFNCTCKALLKDWSKREIWEPFIWEAQQATDDGLDLVKQLQLAKEEALYLMKTCKAPNARVGAIARYIEVIKTEIELKQSLGQLPRARMEPTVKVDVNVNQRSVTSVMLARYEQLVKTGTVGDIQGDDCVQSVAETKSN